MPTKTQNTHFSERLYYADSLSSFVGGTACYNGNIAVSQMLWGDTTGTFAYTYDSMNRLVESRVLKYKSIVYTVPATAVTSSYDLEHAAFEPNFMEYRITEYNGNIETCYTPQDTTLRIFNTIGYYSNSTYYHYIKDHLGNICAVVNFLLHRSYVIEAPLRVFIFDNRIEIHSPGMLPEGVTLDSIKQGVSVPRNKLLFNHGINLLPYTGAGSGITRALLYTPNIQFENNETIREFVTTIQREPNENNQVANQTEHQVEHQVEHQPKVRLTQQQKDIVNFCSVPRTAQEIMNRIGVYNQSRSRRKYIQPLIDIGVLEMTDPDRPNAPNQKYRKVRT